MRLLSVLAASSRGALSFALLSRLRARCLRCGGRADGSKCQTRTSSATPAGVALSRCATFAATGREGHEAEVIGRERNGGFGQLKCRS